MKKFLLFSLLMMSCAGNKNVTLAFTDSVKLDHDQIVVCPFILKFNAMECMTLEEFVTRMGSQGP